MKILGFTILLVLIINFQAIAQDNERNYNEYTGYMVYDTIDNNGYRVSVKTPVQYKAVSEYDYSAQDNDISYQYRDYNVEMQRNEKEQEAKNKIDTEEERINSAAYYPMYFD
jgi:hypothetical protein